MLLGRVEGYLQGGIRSGGWMGCAWTYVCGDEVGNVGVLRAVVLFLGGADGAVEVA